MRLWELAYACVLVPRSTSIRLVCCAARWTTRDVLSQLSKIELCSSELRAGFVAASCVAASCGTASFATRATAHPDLGSKVRVIRYFILLLSARSRLYRRRSLQDLVNNTEYYFSAFVEIYKMFILLHRSNLSNLANFRQTFWWFLAQFTQTLGFFIKFVVALTDFDKMFSEFSRNNQILKENFEKYRIKL